ncbi:L,D-transpeptidase catalytic domain protein [Leptospira biflexa]|nr:L,D-transpeptidase catalytic domain protein [Leptospira biflexa]TGM40336.1 L,D-transpeptidase catalytic domain protein [Leptospira biflexa]
MTVNHWVAGSSPAGGAVLLFSKLKSTSFPKSLDISLRFSSIFRSNFHFYLNFFLFFLISGSFPSFLVASPKEVFPSSVQVPDVYQSEQILLIIGKPGETQGKLHFFSVEGGEWKTILSSIPVWFGKSGLIQKEKKREGDGFTPKGDFPIKRVLGKGNQSIRNLEYIKIRKNDHWSDVTTSKHYNQFIRQKEKGATPLWNSAIYELLIVIEHNTNPSIPGFGSMIFLHPWAETKPTSGCVGIKLTDLESIIQRLDGKKNPYFLLIESEDQI